MVVVISKTPSYNHCVGNKKQIKSGIKYTLELFEPKNLNLI